MQEQLAVQIAIALAQMGHGVLKAFDLGRHQFSPEFMSVRGEKKQTLAPIFRSGFLIDVVFFDQLLEHPAETLFGDPQHVEQLRHRHARAAADKMQHPMMGTPKVQTFQDLVRVGDKIPIGKEQHLDQSRRLVLAQFIYVSHVDILFPCVSLIFQYPVSHDIAATHNQDGTSS